MNKNEGEKAIIMDELLSSIFESKEVVENKTFSNYYVLKNK